MMDHSRLREALEFLNDLYENLPRDKSGEELLNQIEWRIRRYQGEDLNYIRAALGAWLHGTDSTKFEYAVDLIDRLGVVEYIPALKTIRNQIKSGQSCWPSYWLSFIEAVLKNLYSKSEQP